MVKNIHNNLQVLQQIEWNEIFGTLKSASFFNSTTDLIIKPLTNTEKLKNKLQETAQFENHLYDNEFLTLTQELSSFNEDDILEATLVEINKGAACKVKVLNEIALLHEFITENIKLLGKYELLVLDHQIINNYKQKMTKDFYKEFRSFVSKDGIADLLRHPKFRPLFEKQIELEQTIRKKLTYLMGSSDIEKRVQFSSFDIINDRYVIPIKSDSYQSSLGQVISRSESGNTLFVEPISISQMNYNRLQIVIEIDALWLQLEKRLSSNLIPFTDELKIFSDVIHNIDEFNSRVRFAKFYGLTLPEISKTREINLKNAFHPLIEKPVKNDINLSKDKAGIIISGPNTGGKTVTLKVLALTQLFLKYGLFVPAEHAKIYPYENVFYFGNDQQNLEQGLSSFAAEVKNYTELTVSLSNTNLILIDEIFNSTSSEEASALAIALFKKIQEISETHIVVSSHHQTLKTFLHQDTSFISAHVGYNLEDNSPTYKLHYGSPGSSYALEVFKKMISQHQRLDGVYDESLKFLDNKMIHYEKLLQSLGSKENKLQELVRENSSLQKELKNQKKAAEGVIRLKVEEEVAKVQKKLNKIKQKAELVLTDVKRNKIQKEKALANKYHPIQSELNSFKPEKDEDLSTKYGHLQTPKVVQVGQTYFSVNLRKNVLIKKVNLSKKIATISKGAITMTCSFTDLREKDASGNSTKNKAYNKISITHTQGTSVEYDCRGMRLEEFQDTVENSLSNLLVGNIPYLNFIHGHGDGILKKWIRRFIKQNPDIQMEENKSGNDGETRIILS